MAKKNIKITQLVTVSDMLVLLAVVAGLLIVFLVDQTAIKLIGGAISVLAFVTISMLYYQRLNDLVDSRPKNYPTNAPDYKTTVKDDSSAKRQVIEDFDTSFKDQPELKTNYREELSLKSEEGFRIISKSNSENLKFAKPTEKEKEKTKVNKAKFKTALEVQQQKKIEEERKKLEEVQSQKEEVSEKIDDNVPKDLPLNEELSVKEEFEYKEDLSIAEELDTNGTESLSNPEESQIEETSVEENQPEISEEEDKQQLEIPINLLLEEVPGFGDEPKKEFEYFLGRILVAIKNILPSNTVAFYLANAERKELVLETIISDTEDSIKKGDKFTVANDIVSQIYIGAKPEILTEINPKAELDLIPYYTDSVNITSFLGVPVFYDNAVVGVLCVDSKHSDVFDNYSVSILGHFTKLLSGVVYSYAQKYDLLQVARTMDAVNVFQSMLMEEKADIEDVYSILANVVKHIFDVKSSGVVGFDENINNWIVKSNVISEDNPGITGQVIDINNSVVSNCLMSSGTTVISPVTDDIIRVNQNEENLDGGVFVSVPLCTKYSTYGALYFESKNVINISQFDLNILEVVASHAAHTIEKLHVISMLNTNSLLDPNTGILNPPAFYTRLEEEVKRHKDFEIPIVMCLFQLDKYAAFSPEEHSDRRERIIFHVLNIFRKKIKDYDIIARADENVYSIVMVGMNIEDAQLWAQKIRQEVASTMIELDGQQFSVTVSMGLAALDKSDSLESFLANCRRVLDKSIQKTNTVNVFG